MNWSNVQTSLVFLWLTSEESAYQFWANRAQDLDESSLSRELRDALKEGAPELAGVYSDLLDSALAEVNWVELAGAFKESIRKASMP